MDLEEDTYSIIFSALKHPSRRKIIRILAESPNTYTELLTKLGVETGFLNYYLESLDGLIQKDRNDKYCLSGLGRSALGLVRQVEEPASKAEAGKFSLLGFRVNITYVILAIVLALITSNVYWTYTLQRQNEEKINLIGEKILSSKVLLGESIEIINTTIRENRINFHLWVVLLKDVSRISDQFSMMKSLDADHSSSWSQVTMATDSLSRFSYDVSERLGYRFYPYMNFTLGQGWAISLTKIMDDLVEIDINLPSNIVLGVDSRVVMTDESVTELLAVGLKLQQDIDMARRTVSIPESLPNT